MAAERVKQIEPVLRPRHSHVGEPAFLLQAGRRIEAAAVREEAFLHAEHEDDRELEPLDHVQGDQRHPLRPVVHGVDIAHERDVLEEGLQAFARRQPIVL